MKEPGEAADVLETPGLELYVGRDNISTKHALRPRLLIPPFAITLRPHDSATYLLTALAVAGLQSGTNETQSYPSGWGAFKKTPP